MNDLYFFICLFSLQSATKSLAHLMILDLTLNLSVIFCPGNFCMSFSYESNRPALVKIISFIYAIYKISI